MKCQNCGLENCFELYFRWFGVYIEPIVGAYVAEYDISEARCVNCFQSISTTNFLATASELYQ